jgi:2Fe-2S ferredoxin
VFHVAKNPFIDADAPPLPTRPYRLTLKNTGQVIEVDPNDLPPHHDGHVGSVLSLLLENDADIDHTCGGVCACSTCHVYILAGLDTSPEPIEEEEDQLDFAPALRNESRLACQFVPNGTQDVVVELPAWNRNEVSEDH